MSYSVKNAERFNWSSVSGDLLIDRVMHLEKFLIGPNILEAGCGGGAYTNFLANQGFQVTGVDLHSDFLEIAKGKGLNGTFIQADILKLPFNDNQFDTTFCFDVLEHIDDVLAIQEIARVTSQRIILTVPQQDNDMHNFGLTFITYQDPTHLRYYTEDSLSRLCSVVKHKNIEIVKEGLISGFALIEHLIKPSPRFALRNMQSRSVYAYLAKKLLKRVPFKEINLGLAAIIDL